VNRYDHRMALSGTFSRLHNRDGWIDGVVVTHNHIVTVYYEAELQPVARFDLVRNGVLHVRYIKGRKFTRRGLSIMAAKFARELTND
jgi:hypothetical protein